MEYEVEGLRQRGRPKRTWREGVKEDCQARKLNTEDAIARGKWRKAIKDVRWSGRVWVGEFLLAYPGSPETTAVKWLCVYNYKLYLCHFITFKYSLRAMMTIGNERLVITPPQQFDTAFNAFIQKNCANHEFWEHIHVIHWLQDPKICFKRKKTKQESTNRVTAWKQPLKWTSTVGMSNGNRF